MSLLTDILPLVFFINTYIFYDFGALVKIKCLYLLLRLNLLTEFFAMKKLILAVLPLVFMVLAVDVNSQNPVLLSHFVPRH